MEEKRLPISYIKTEMTCKICSTTEGKMESIPCKETNKRLIRKIYHCTNIQVYPVNDVISPVCDPCRELIDSYDLHAKPILRDFVIKADMNVASVNYDPFAEDQDNTPAEPVLDILEPIVKIESLPPQENVKQIETIIKEPKARKRVELVVVETDDDYESDHAIKPKRKTRIKVGSKMKNDTVVSTTPDKVVESVAKENLSPNEKQPLEEEKSDDEESQDFPPLSDSDSDWSQPLSKLKPEQPEQIDVPKKKKGRPRTAKPKRLLQKCDICEKVVYYMREHMRVHQTDKHKKCPFCERTFSFRQSLKHHIMKHKGERPFECDVCGNRYVSKGDLNYHMEAHSTELKYQCHVCSKAFNQAIKLKAHLKIHLGIKRKEKVQYFTCEMCGRVFNKKNNLNVHMLRHRGEKNFVCEICSKAFVNVPALKRHTEFHNRQTKILAHEGAVRCEICGKAYTNERNLTAHLKTHEPGYKHTWSKKNKDPRPKEDNQAPKAPEPVQCDICFKYFEKGSLMRKHRTRHFNEDGQQRKMRDRIRLVPDEHTPRCDICDRPFAKIKYMKEHRKKHFTERGVNGNKVEDMSLIDKVEGRRRLAKTDSYTNSGPTTLEKVSEPEYPKVYPQFHYPPVMPTIVKIENFHHYSEK